MRKFRSYFPHCRSLLGLAAIVVLACGPMLYDDNEFPGYFMPQSGYTPGDAMPYYYTPAFLYESQYDYQQRSDMPPSPDENLRGWKDYCQVQVSDSAAAALIYQGEDDPRNPLLNALKQHPAAWDYLLLARRIEKASAAGGSAWDPTPADTAMMQQLFGMVTDSLQKVSDPFLKDKYAFQSVKLAHELHQDDSCISLYDHYFGNSTDSSVMKYWSLSRKGGALLDKGDTAQAVYVFAQVFDRCPSRRQAAYMSLRRSNILFTPAALQYCKGDREKMAVYTLCAIQPWQDALPLLKAMVKIDPAHPYLELIMGREINKNESYYFRDRDAVALWHWKDRDTSGANAKDQQALSYFGKLEDFARQCADNPQVKDPAYWNTAASYISYVRGDYKTAKPLLAKAEKQASENAVLMQQIRLQQLLLATDESKEITPALEEKVLPLLQDLKNSTNFYKNNALVLACQHLAARYRSVASAGIKKSRGWLLCNRPKPSEEEQYAPAKAFLLTMLTASQLNDSGAYFMSNTDQYRIEDTTSAATLENVIRFFSQAKASPQDSQFMRLTGLDLNYFYFIKGRRALAVFQYQQAADAWRHVAGPAWQQDPFKTYLAANPFATGIKDTHAPVPADTVHYTPYQFAVRMQQLAEAVKKDPAHAAENYYLLGCGAYNMSYYGNSWLLVKRSWSSADIPYDIDPALKLTDSLNYYTASQAKAYFDSAMQVSSDKELAARACFMAAKCEQKAFYVYLSRHRKLWEGIHPEYYFYGNDKKGTADSLKRMARQAEDDHFHQYFKIMNSRYSNAQFNWEVIRECATYRDFVQGKESRRFSR